MTMPVLATKLFVPPQRHQAVERPRLTAKLVEGERAGRKLTLISAPAGFGKTTLLGQWIAVTSQRDPAMGVAWLSLEESDNDPARFLASSLKNLLSTMIYTGDSSCNLGTIVNGRWVVKQQHHRDQSKIKRKFISTLKNLKNR